MSEIDIRKLLFSYEHSRIEEILKNPDKSFSYYTNLETLHSILKYKEIWMRNVSCMNDFSEIRQGLSLIRSVLCKEGNKNLLRLLQDLHNISRDMDWKEFLSIVLIDSDDYFLGNTYIACISEHDKQDDELGKLSMWRAYGRGNGGALILNKDLIFKPPFIINGLMLSPVAYFTMNQYEIEFLKILSILEDNANLFRSLGPVKFRQLIQDVLVAAILSIKHPGFKEECEWRLIYQDSGLLSDNKMKEDITCIAGIPQKVIKIQLSDIAGQLIHHTIIGPTEFGKPVLKVIENDLRKIFTNSSDIDKYIKFSGIPIRPGCI